MNIKGGQDIYLCGGVPYKKYYIIVMFATGGPIDLSLPKFTFWNDDNDDRIIDPGEIYTDVFDNLRYCVPEN